MATNKYDETTFNLVNGKGQVMSVNCYTTNLKIGFCHTVECDDMIVEMPYFNRPLECFRYKTALYKFVDKYFKGVEKDGLNNQLKAIADEESIKCEEWVKVCVRF